MDPDTTKSVKRQLSPMPKITGVVRDESGKTVKGATLQICPMAREEVRSDAEGRFEVSLDIAMFPRERPRTLLLVCRYAEGNLASVTMLPDGAKTCDVTLKPGVTVRGKVVNAQGRGIANARIRPMIRQTMWNSIITRDSIKTDSGGNFEIRAIPAEHEYDLLASAEGYGSKSVDITADEAVNYSLKADDIVLATANLTVSGVVVDTQGKPVAKARIESCGFEYGQPERCGTQADSKGQFTLAGVCEGRVNIRVSATAEGRPLSARAVAAGGATGLKIVAREGHPATQYFSAKTYEQIIQSSEKIIAGVAVDESGSPVGGVPVGVRCIKKKREDGKFWWAYSSYPDLKATTDQQGRFAIELQEEAEYNLLFSPDNQAAIILYDIPAGKRDLKVTLPGGGMVIGRLVRMEKGQKTPIANVEVKIEQPDRASYMHLGFDRDRTAITDAEGRFRFEHLQTLIRSDRLKPEFAPRVWEIKYGDTSKTIAFYEGTVIGDFELMVGAAPGEAQSLLGKALPGFDGIKINPAPDAGKGKALLLCFFDMNQRPSRNCITQLAKQAEQLKEKGVTVVAVQASKVDESKLDEWVKENNIPFSVGMVQGDEEKARFSWGIKALPWLILTDREHIVRAEGFGLTELEDKFKTANE